MRDQAASVHARILGLALVALAAGACRTEKGSEGRGLIEVTETDLDGESTKVRERPGIVDINSSIQVALDRKAIGDELRKTVGAGGPSGETLAQLELLAKSIEAGQARLPNVSRALGEWTRSSHAPAENQRLGAALKEFNDAIAPVLGLIESSRPMRDKFETLMNDLIERAPESSQTEQDRILLQIASEWVQSERALVQRQAREQGGYVRLGAWLDRNGNMSPIHLPGFDTVPEGEFYEVDRWKIALSEDQKAALVELDKSAKRINAAGGDPKLLFESWKRSVLDGMRALLDQCIDEFRAKAEEFADSQAPGVAAARNLRDSAQLLARLARRLRDKYSQFDPGSLSPQGWLEALRGLHGDLDEVVDAVRTVAHDFDELKSAASQIPQTAREFFDTLVKTQCVAEIQAKLGLLAREFGIQRAAMEIAEYSDAVLRLDITEVPESTQFDLRRAGLREPQDRVSLRLATGKTTAPGATPAAERTVAAREFELERVLPHLETTVGLIFANPDGNSSLTGEFQAAPSYSVLYKWGSRDNRLRNALFDWGIGLNLSALDFDKDDTPELGIAAVVAGFHNYVQAGYGYNPFEDTAYWFFGINLPLPTWSFPVSGSSNSSK